MVKGLRAAVAVLASVFLVTGFAGPAVAEEAPPPESATLADQLAEAARSGASGAEELAAEVGLPATGANSLTVSADGRVAATVTFGARPSDAELEAVAALATVDRVYSFSPAAAVTVDPARIPELQALPGVASVVPVVAASTGAMRAPVESSDTATVSAAPQADASCRAIPVEADGPLRTQLARETFGVDGAGVTIGIISDSYGLATEVTTPDEDVAMGVLPGPGNPCGYETPVEVLVESDNGGDDEGRAMAQLVHGIAPGAKLMFASGWGGPNGMADSIIQLAEAGADIIVDDLGYATETYFQQGLISVAINTVRAEGVAYYTSAGNSNVAGWEEGPSAGKPIASWQTPSYRGIQCPDWVEVPSGMTEYDCLDFDPTSVEDAYDLMGLNGSLYPQLLLSWGEPLNGVTSSFELQLYAEGEAGPELFGAGVNIDPSIPNRLLPAGEVEEGVYRLVVVRDLTDRVPNEPAIWIGTMQGSDGIDWREHDTSTGDDVVGPVTFGHPADGSGVGVAAADWRTPDTPESFTSPGPGTVRFEPLDPLSTQPAAALPAPVRIQAPEIAGVDGTRTSFFGGPGDGLYRFFGTSAAAPNVAATHALATQFAPTLSADEVTETLIDTAAPMTNPFDGILPDEDVFGAGLADGYSLLAALPAPAVTGLAASALSATSLAAEWDGGLPVSGYQVELRHQGEVVESGTLEADETATTFSGLVPETAYRVRVAALNSAGEPGAWAESGEVRTPRPPQPGTLPASPGESALTPATAGGLVATPDRVRAGESVTITGLPTSAWVAGWAYSTPTVLGWGWTGAEGSTTFRIPEQLPAGAHRLAVTDASGALIGWVGVTVLADAPVPARPAGLASTGVETGAMTAAVLLVLLAGAAFTVLGRRRARRS